MRCGRLAALDGIARVRTKMPSHEADAKSAVLSMASPTDWRVRRSCGCASAIVS